MSKKSSSKGTVSEPTLYAGSWWKKDMVVVFNVFFDGKIPKPPAFGRAPKAFIAKHVEKYATNMAKFFNDVEGAVIQPEDVDEFGKEDIEYYNKHLKKIKLEDMGGAAARMIKFLKFKGFDKKISKEARLRAVDIIRMRSARIFFIVLSSLSFTPKPRKGVPGPYMRIVTTTLEK